MIYKVGQRVRLIASAHYPECVGNEYVVVEDFGPHPLYPDSYFYRLNDGLLASSSTLAPLTPPSADSWASEKVRELVRPKPMDLERVKEKA